MSVRPSCICRAIEYQRVTHWKLNIGGGTVPLQYYYHTVSRLSDGNIPHFSKTPIRSLRDVRSEPWILRLQKRSLSYIRVWYKNMVIGRWLIFNGHCGFYQKFKYGPNLYLLSSYVNNLSVASISDRLSCNGKFEWIPMLKDTHPSSFFRLESYHMYLLASNWSLKFCVDKGRNIW